MRNLKRIMPVAALIMMAAVFMVLSSLEYNTCMGVPVVNEKKFEGYACISDADLAPVIKFNGEAVAIDLDTNTFYISQVVDEDSDIYDLTGNIEIDNGEYLPYFLKDDAFKNIYQAVNENHTFKFVAISPDKERVDYNVVFTTLPVLKMNGGFYNEKEAGVPRYIGNVYLWDTVENKRNNYSAVHSESFWHRRANPYDKESWKLSLKTETGENNGISIMNLGKDEDWILNPLFVDGTDIREKLAMKLWEQLQEGKAYPLYMSVGDYIEVVRDGDYKGIYLMQRRVDQKYLNLDEDDILFKSLDAVYAEDVDEAYEVTYSGQSEEVTEQLRNALYNAEIYDHIDINNWIDTALLIQLGCMIDNNNYKNMFFVFKMEDYDYKIYMLLWDTDLSFDYSGNTDPQKLVKRMEYDKLKELYPEIDVMMAQRWFQLREGVFSMENIRNIADEYRNYLTDSGATIRDSSRWQGVSTSEEDLTQLYSFTEERTEFLDSYYSSFIEQ